MRASPVVVLISLLASQPSCAGLIHVLDDAFLARVEINTGESLRRAGSTGFTR
jgi:hypothetical protein